MRVVTRFLAALGVQLIVTMPALSAQHPQTRKGFWIGFGFGGCSARVSCTGCTTHREARFSGLLKMGWTPGSQLPLCGAACRLGHETSRVANDMWKPSA